MSVTSIQRDQNNNVSIVRITVDTDLSVVTAPFYILSQQETIDRLNKGTWTWYYTDTLLISGNDANAFFEFTDLTFSTIEMIAPSPNGIVNPGLKNQIAYYPANGNAVSGIRSSSFNTVYVSTTGNDLNDGSITFPFRTITHALSSITTASSSNLFVIDIQTGVYSESNISLKPWIFIEGNNSVLNVSGNVSANASWSSGGTIYFKNFSILNIGGTFNFDVSSALSNECIVSFDNIQFTSTTLNFIGAQTLILHLVELFSFSGSLSVNITNAYGALFNCTVNNFSYTATDLTQSFVFKLISCEVFGAVSVTSSGGAMGVDFIVDSTLDIGSLSGIGTGTNLSMSTNSVSTSAIPTLSGGATVTYINVADGLTANYTPINYTPTATATSPVTSLPAHLKGIDNQFGILKNTYISDSATGVSLTSATPENVVSISLPAGNYEVSGVVGFLADATTTISQLASSVSLFSNTLPAFPTENNIQLLTTTFGVGSSNFLSCGSARISVGSTTTIYLVCRAVFEVSTMTADGFIKAVPV